jgi:hypothetical protein
MAARDRSTTALVAAQVLLLLMFLAALGSWPAGRSYGSRYLVTVMPFMCLPLAYLFRDAGRTARRVGMAMLAVSVLMQLPGVLVDFSKVEQAQARQDDGQSAKARLWLWPEADFIANSRAAFRQVPENLRYLAGVEDPPVVARTAGTEERGFAQQFAFSLDFWWLYLFYLGAVSAPVALLGLIVPATISAICAWKLFALVRDAGHGEQGVTVASG